MMRRWLGATAMVGLLALASGCDNVVPPASVGTRVLSHSQSGNGDVRLAYEASEADAVLLTDQAAFDAWFGSLPPSVQDDLQDDAGAVDLTAAFAVVGYYPRCQEESRVLDRGEGAVTFDVYVPEGKEEILCAWSPIQLDVYRVGLDEVGVSDAAEVKIVEAER